MPEEGVINIECLQNQVAPQAVLFSILKEKGFTSAQATQIFSMLGEEKTARYGNRTLTNCFFDRGRILMERNSVERKKQMRIPETGVYVYDDNATFEIKESEITEGFKGE